MSPQMLSLILFAIQEAIKLEPGIAAELKALFAKGDPTPEDWAALQKRIADASYEKYDPTPIPAVQTDAGHFVQGGQAVALPHGADPLPPTNPPANIVPLVSQVAAPAPALPAGNAPVADASSDAIVQPPAVAPAPALAVVPHPNIVVVDGQEVTRGGK